MEATVSPNGSENLQTITNKGEDYQVKYMDFFREISTSEAQQLTLRVRIGSELHGYIMKVLYTVREGGKVLVPADFPLPQKSLKAAIKRYSRDPQLDIPVRFDKATNGGFIVRQATVDEAVQGDRRGAELGEARRKK